MATDSQILWEKLVARLGNDTPDIPSPSRCRCRRRQKEKAWSQVIVIQESHFLWFLEIDHGKAM